MRNVAVLSYIDVKCASLGERLANERIATLPSRMGICEIVSREKEVSMSDWGSEQDLLKLEYEQASQTFRQIDVRIWSIYALYVAISSGAFAVGFNSELKIEGLKLIALAAVVILMTVTKMGLVGHLQWYSDILADRLRQIEQELGTIEINQLFLEEKRPYPYKLDCFHKWFCIFRARQLMQVLAVLIMLFWIFYPFKIFLSEECWRWICSLDGRKFAVIVFGDVVFISVFYLCWYGRSGIKKLNRQRFCERTGTSDRNLEDEAP